MDQSKKRSATKLKSKLRLVKKSKVQDETKSETPTQTLDESQTVAEEETKEPLDESKASLEESIAKESLHKSKAPLEKSQTSIRTQTCADFVKSNAEERTALKNQWIQSFITKEFEYISTTFTKMKSSCSICGAPGAQLYSNHSVCWYRPDRKVDFYMCEVFNLLSESNFDKQVQLELDEIIDLLVNLLHMSQTKCFRPLPLVDQKVTLPDYNKDLPPSDEHSERLVDPKVTLPPSDEQSDPKVTLPPNDEQSDPKVTLPPNDEQSDPKVTLPSNDEHSDLKVTLPPNDQKVPLPPSDEHSDPKVTLSTSNKHSDPKVTLSTSNKHNERRIVLSSECVLQQVKIPSQVCVTYRRSQGNMFFLYFKDTSGRDIHDKRCIKSIDLDLLFRLNPSLSYSKLLDPTLLFILKQNSINLDSELFAKFCQDS